VVPLRRIAAALTGLTLLAACQTDVEPITGEELVEQAREAVDDLRADDAPPGQPEADPPGEQAPPGEPAGDAEPPAAVEEDHRGAVFDERAGIGGMCRAYLRGDVQRMVVEVGHQQGAELSQSALDHLLAVLRGVVDKPAGLTVVTSELPGGPRTWSRDDLDAISRTSRQHTSGPEQVVMHVLALRGEFEQPDVLGVAFDASSFALFPDRLDRLAGLLGGRTLVEQALLVHEAGHLLCLINITYTSDIDHEDPEHPHHSKDPGSVMYWAVEHTAVGQVFSGPPPDDFTANDRADLEGLRTGRY
jgi:hypothetical protein